MKKTIALFSSLLIFAGVKAQTTPVKKETIKPASEKPVASSTNNIHKVTDKGAPTQLPIHKEIKGSPVMSKGSPVTSKGSPVMSKGSPVTSKGAPAAKSVNR
jgi:hypothetical protein